MGFGKEKLRRRYRRFCASLTCEKAEVPFPLFVFWFLLTALPVVLLLLLLLSRRVWYPGTAALPAPFPLLALSELLSSALLASMLSVVFFCRGGRRNRVFLGLGLILCLCAVLRLLLLLFGAGKGMLTVGAVCSAAVSLLLLFCAFRCCRGTVPSAALYTVLRLLRLVCCICLLCDG